LPRQSLPRRYFQTGDIEVVRRDTLLNGSVSGHNVYPLLIKHEDMVDIDSWRDLEAAKGKLKL
jgi:N-acylneuraminate cytidylyltransferase